MKARFAFYPFFISSIARLAAITIFYPICVTMRFCVAASILFLFRRIYELIEFYLPFSIFDLVMS